MALVDLIQQCNFVSAGHFTLYTIYQGVPHLYYLRERRGLVVKKLDSQTYSWRFEANRSRVQRNSSVKFLTAQFKFKDLDLEYFLFR